LRSSRVLHYVARFARIATSALAAGGFAAAVAVPGSAGASAPRAQLRSFVCQAAVQPASRAISVTSVMRPVSGTKTLEVRFDLLSRANGASGYSEVSGRDLERWLTPSNKGLGSRPGDVWIVAKPVVGLPAPATYRFRVSFRWLNRRHHVIATAVRTTSGCRQPELRPDLVVQRIAAPVQNKKGTLDLYTVTIGNTGATAAGAFTVGLNPDASEPSVKVSGLLAHHTAQVTLRGPLCSASAPPTITADLYQQVDDFDRANNVATASCSAVTTPF
jgi:hypothetical protein